MPPRLMVWLTQKERKTRRLESPSVAFIVLNAATTGAIAELLATVGCDTDVATRCCPACS